MVQPREYWRLNQCITLRALGMDMSGHNGTFGADPHIMCLTRVFVQCLPKEAETVPPLLSRPCIQITERSWWVTCQCLCQSLNETYRFHGALKDLLMSAKKFFLAFLQLDNKMSIILIWPFDVKPKDCLMGCSHLQSHPIIPLHKSEEKYSWHECKLEAVTYRDRAMMMGSCPSSIQLLIVALVY